MELGTDGTALASDIQWSFRAAAGPLTPSAAYHFSELEGVTAADASGNGNTAMLMSAQWGATGRLGTGLAFVTSSPQWVELPASDTLRLPDSFTLQL